MYIRILGLSLGPAPSLTQYHPITVSGTVGGFFGFPKIDNCRIVQ